MDRQFASRGEWKRQGWFQPKYVGYYQLASDVGRRMVQGLLRQEGAGIGVYIKNPPRPGRYEHEPCLQLIKEDWFKLHFERPPRSFESAVLFTERFLSSCLRGHDS